MTIQKKEEVDYILEYTKSKNAKDIINSSKIFNDKGFGVWSFKKLIFLEYYLRPYLNIMIKNGFKCIFIDLFSSSGVNKIKEENIKSIGSPIISLLKGVIPIKKSGKNNRFKKWFFIEKNSSFCEALTKRVNESIKIINRECSENLKKEDIKIICADCNKVIGKVVDNIKKEYKDEKVSILAFIDPYAFTEIEWESWKKLLSLTYVDIIFTLPLNTISRGFKNCKSPEKYLPPSLIKLSKVKNILDINKFSEAYAKDISKLVNRSISYYDKGIKVKNDQNKEIYRVEFFTHCENATKLCLKKAKKLDKLNVNTLRTLLHLAQGEQKSILDFPSKRVK